MFDAKVIPDKDPVKIKDAVGTEAFNFFVKGKPEYHKNTIKDDTLYLPLILNGMKNGFTGGYWTVDERFRVSASNHLQELGLPHKIHYDEEYELTNLHVTTDRKLLESMEHSVEDKNYGRFLGVPQEDNKWFDSGDEITSSIPIPKYLDRDFKDIEYARLVSWVCKPTEEGIKRTIKIGKTWYEFAEDVLLNEYGYTNPINWAEKEMNRSNHPWYKNRENAVVANY